MNSHLSRPAIAMLLAWSALGLAHAQDETPPADDSLYKIELATDERVSEGRAAFLQGEADASGHKFILEGLDLDDPIAVSVFAKNPGDKLRVRLIKDSWDAPERDAETNDQQRADFLFRTFDGFKIWITAEQPTEYQLIVQVGDKLPLPVPSIAVPASEYMEPQAARSANAPSPSALEGAGSGVSFSYLELALIAMLLLVIATFGAFILMRRKPRLGTGA